MNSSTPKLVWAKRTHWPPLGKPGRGTFLPAAIGVDLDTQIAAISIWPVEIGGRFHLQMGARRQNLPHLPSLGGRPPSPVPLLRGRIVGAFFRGGARLKLMGKCGISYPSTPMRNAQIERARAGLNSPPRWIRIPIFAGVLKRTDIASQTRSISLGRRTFNFRYRFGGNGRPIYRTTPRVLYFSRNTDGRINVTAAREIRNGY